MSSAGSTLNELMEGGGTIADLFEVLERFGAAVVKLTAKGEDGKPTRMVIVVDGTEECTEIYAAVEAVEVSWDGEPALDVRSCPIFGEARGTSECEKCGGNILECPVYGPGERRRLAEEA